MLLHNIFELILVAGAYISLFALVPFWIRGCRISGKNAFDNFISSFAVGNIVLITLVLLLSLAGIYRRSTAIASVILLCAAYRWFVKREETKAFFRNLETKFNLFLQGYYHRNAVVKDVRACVNKWFKRMLGKVGNPVNFIIIAVAFGFAFYFRSYHSIHNMYYGSSDMYLHTEWIKYIDINVPFQGGVYPFGLHAAVSALDMIFGFDVFTVMRMFGVLIGMSTVLVLYYVLKRVFKSNLAVNVAMVFYCVLNVFNPMAVERQTLALPQEFGMIFLCLTGYYLHDYFKTNKKSSLWFFICAVALTLSAHFFITIYAVVLCGAVFITHLVYMKKAVFFRLVFAVVCSLGLALLPMVISVAQGNKLQDSLYWALGMLEFQQEEPPEDPEEEARLKREEQLRKLKDPIGTLANAYFFTNEPNNLGCLKTEWFIFYLFSAGVGMLYPFFKFEDKNKRWIIMACALYSGLTLFLRLLPYFDMKSIMEPNRMLAFYIYAVPLALGAPFELMHDLSCKMGKRVVAAYSVAAAAIGAALAAYIIVGKNYGFYCRTGRMQYNGAVIAYYKITNEYEDYKWTIVSTTDEYSLCLNKGSHYELTDFIIHMNEYDSNDELIVPTEQVFIYVDKRPTDYTRAFNIFDGTPPPEPALNLADAVRSIEPYLPRNKGNALYMYQNLTANRVLQTKAYMWAEEYRKYYPREMSVYYEDDDIIVYRIEQNPFALSSLAVPYSGNYWGDKISAGGEPDLVPIT